MSEFCVIVEDRADFQTATHLAERVLLEKIDWLERDYIPGLFRWNGLEENTDYSRWQDIRQIIDQFKQRGLTVPRYLGFAKDGPFKADGAAASTVLKFIRVLQRKKQRDIKAVVLIRDVDTQPERKAGLRQAREEQVDLRIVIGVADPKREAWVLNGFEPLTPKEKRLLREITEQLTFHPCEEAHRLRASASKEPERQRNPKIILEQLTGGDYSRESQCWEETSLDILLSRGEHTGLAEYIKEVETELSTLLDNSSNPANALK
jgi:hypothetical protein